MLEKNINEEIEENMNEGKEFIKRMIWPTRGLAALCGKVGPDNLPEGVQGFSTFNKKGEWRKDHYEFTFAENCHIVVDIVAYGDHSLEIYSLGEDGEKECIFEGYFKGASLHLHSLEPTVFCFKPELWEKYEQAYKTFDRKAYGKAWEISQEMKLIKDTQAGDWLSI